ncbi:hypothetical protein [Henriciella sp.]|uniref:hypothetical protein n=1 Tax=Henriciella sp. TaxID=1968823 RepID=UPI002634537A|nr:hypothetical protein [Henriciella sp.]
MAYRFLCVALITGILIFPALAQEQGLRNAAKGTVACLEVEGADQRLACFEEAASKLSGALSAEMEAPAASARGASSSQPDTPVASAPAAGEGNQPSWARAPQPQDDETVAEEISISVVRILRNNVGRHFFITEDGQEWEQTITQRVKPPKTLPAEATIERTLFGSLLLTFDDGPTGAYKVRRTK